MTETTDFIAEHYSLEELEILAKKLRILRRISEMRRQHRHERLLKKNSPIDYYNEGMRDIDIAGQENDAMTRDALEYYIEFVQKQIEYKKQPNTVQFLTERIRTVNDTIGF